MTMPVECVSEDFSDPEAVSGSSTSFRARIAYLGSFSPHRSMYNSARVEETTNLHDSYLEFLKTSRWAIFCYCFVGGEISEKVCVNLLNFVY